MYFHRIPLDVVENKFSPTHNMSSTPSPPPTDLSLSDIVHLDSSPKAPTFSPITNVYSYFTTVSSLNYYDIATDN